MIMTGDFGEANKAGWQGAAFGAPIGGISGSVSAYRYAVKNDINPLNGKYNKPLYHYTTTENTDIIMKTQLGRTDDSWSYLTPDGNKTPIQAQIDLSLPQSNTAESLILLKPNSIYPRNFILQRNVTGNVYLRGGGGYEFIYKRTIPNKYLIRIK
ncbi:MAG: hypothetical protein LBR79_05430 [Oscillospiraceae bacterium]|jgi:hypothetical protein|nr:hypothetical protein [Oscillospiraceae bacterium]